MNERNGQCEFLSNKDFILYAFIRVFMCETRSNDGVQNKAPGEFEKVNNVQNLE